MCGPGNIGKRKRIYTKGTPIVLVKAILGGNPQKPYTILGNGNGTVLRKSVINRELSKFDLNENIFLGI